MPASVSPTMAIRPGHRSPRSTRSGSCEDLTGSVGYERNRGPVTVCGGAPRAFLGQVGAEQFLDSRLRPGRCRGDCHAGLAVGGHRVDVENYGHVLAAAVFAHESAAFGVHVLAGAGVDVGPGGAAGAGPGAPRRLASAAMASSSKASRRACWSAARRVWNSAMARRCSAWAASWRTRAATAGFFRVAGPPGVMRLVAGELGDGFLGAASSMRSLPAAAAAMSAAVAALLRARAGRWRPGAGGRWRHRRSAGPHARRA